MAEVGSVSVKLTAETAKFEKAMTKATERLAKFSDAAKRVGAAAGIGFASLSAIIYKTSDAANTQRIAMMRLSGAAKANGKITQDQVGELYAYASELQNVTTMGDEATIKTMALLASFKLTKDGIKSLIPGIQDMSAALGVDMNSAALAVGRALDGSVGSLSRYGVQLSKVEEAVIKTGTSQQKAEVIANALRTAVGGAAEEMAKTSKGAMTQFSNAFGDLNEEIGFIIEAPVASFFKDMTKAVSVVISYIQSLNEGTREFLGKLIIVSTTILGLVASFSGFAAVLPFIINGFVMLEAAAAPFLVTAAQIIFVVAGLIAIVGALRAAWAENLGGIQEKFAAFADFARNVGMFIRDVFFDLVTAVDKAFDGLINVVAEVFALLPRLVTKSMELVASALEGWFLKLAAVAGYLGFDELQKDLKKSAGAVAGVRAEFETMQSDISSAVDTAREFLNPINLIKTGFKGTFEFITGEGGADFAKTAGAFLTETGDLIGRGWEMILKDLGIEFLPPAEMKTLGKTLGQETGKAISEEVLKARDAFRERLAELRGRERIETSPFRDINQVFVDAERERAEVIKLASEAGMSNVEALQLVEDHLIRQAAAAVNSATTTEEQAQAAEFARRELQAAGIGLEKFESQLTGIAWEDVQAIRPPDVSSMLGDAIGKSLAQGGDITPEVAKGAGEDIGAMLGGMLEGQAPGLADAVGVGLTAAGAGAAGPIAGAIITGLQTVFNIVKGAINSIVGTIAGLIPEDRLAKAFSIAAPAAIALGLAFMTFAMAIGGLAPVYTLLGSVILGIVVPVLMMFAFAVGLIYGPLIMVTAAVMVLAGLFGIFAALIPETEAFKRAMSVISHVVDGFIKTLSKGMLDPLMAFAGLFAVFMKALEPVLNMFVEGINKLAPHLFNLMRDLAVAFLHLVEFSMRVGNALIDLAQVMGDWFVLPLIKATNAIANAFLEGTAMMFDVIKWMARLPVIGNEEMALAAEAGAATARGMKESGDNLVSEVEAIIGGLDAFKATPDDFAELAKARDELAGLTYQQAIEEAKRLEKETEEFGESLTNVPQGFKVVEARFKAIVAGESPTALAPETVTPETVTPQQTFIVENVELAAQNVQEFVIQLLEQSQKKGVRYGGAYTAQLGLDTGIGR